MSIWTVFGVIIGALIGTGVVVWLDIIINAIIEIFKRINFEHEILKKRNLKMQCGGIEKCAHIAKNKNRYLLENQSQKTR